ncbi:uncharacterized protein LOC131359304 [Hemibagrus wyckioides]|uniref:uncharacterized protein LOC131359304 n=1 Tax=Hemibagrus wyckioides TaxID=337641 RepID=UPI00266C0B56|nr:uncharacterized protein LOC131359304 [Hemibagrus wyckioides]
MRGVSCDLGCTSLGPREVQLLERWKTAADHLLSRVDDTLKLGLVPGCSCSKPDCDGGCEDRFDDSGVEVHQHLLREEKLLQLPQEIHPLLSLLSEGADVLLPLELLGDGISIVHSSLSSQLTGLEAGWAFCCTTQKNSHERLKKKTESGRITEKGRCTKLDPSRFSAVLSPSSFYLHGAQINLARPKGSDREELGYNGSVSSSPEL